jgi:hypothetical protein
MTEQTGLFRRLEAFEKLMVAANAEASVAFAYLTAKEICEDFGESVKALAEESEQLRQKVGSLLDAAGNENFGFVSVLKRAENPFLEFHHDPDAALG